MTTFVRTKEGYHVNVAFIVSAIMTADKTIQIQLSEQIPGRWFVHVDVDEWTRVVWWPQQWAIAAAEREALAAQRYPWTQE